jgi:predicted transposase/invertase (TIGR01784 family)
MRNSEERSYRDIKNSLDTAKAEGLAEGFGKGRVEGHAEGLVEGRAEGLAKGRAEGRSETLVEVAKNLLSIGTPIESIMKATGLSEEEIKSMI